MFVLFFVILDVHAASRGLWLKKYRSDSSIDQRRATREKDNEWKRNVLPINQEEYVKWKKNDNSPSVVKENTYENNNSPLVMNIQQYKKWNSESSALDLPPPGMSSGTPDQDPSMLKWRSDTSAQDFTHPTMWHYVQAHRHVKNKVDKKQKPRVIEHISEGMGMSPPAKYTKYTKYDEGMNYKDDSPLKSSVDEFRLPPRGRRMFKLPSKNRL